MVVSFYNQDVKNIDVKDHIYQDDKDTNLHFMIVLPIFNFNLSFLHFLPLQSFLHKRSSSLVSLVQKHGG